MAKILLLLVALSGALNLSYEILWLRAYNYGAEGRAFGFPIVLGVYLIGLALGAGLVPKLTEKYGSFHKHSLRTLALFVGLGNLAGYLVIPIIAESATHMERSLAMPLLPILVASMLLGPHLPLLMHYGILPNTSAGKNIGVYYLANIIGSVIGTFITGWFLMDTLSLSEIAATLLIGGALLCVLIYTLADSKVSSFLAVSGLSLVVLGAAFFVHGRLFDHTYERLMFWDGYGQEPKAVKIVENRSGVLMRLDTGTIVGGGVYDGILSVDLIHDRNMIIRPFSMSAFVDKPKTVLVVGIGSASWIRVLTNHPDVEKVVVVEINPGYVELLKGTVGEEVLNNPKVTYHIDDVRRWLVHHPDEKFDAVICNASYNWRTMATSLSSIEFLELIKKHLTPKGVFLLNTTDSKRIFRTAFDVFGEVNRVKNAVVSTQRSFDFSPERLREVLLRYRISGKPVIGQDNPEDMKRLEEIIASFTTEQDIDEDWIHTSVWNNHETLKKLVWNEKIITDDNLGEEYNTSIVDP